MASAIISPVVHRLAKQYSRMSIRIIIADLQMLCRELEARDIDVALCRLFYPLSEEYSAEVLFEDPLAFAPPSTSSTT
ncbi:MAG TPA: LysR substrate-binding domain-containing protein [Hyphomicrobiaceae bacterium]|jgi:DNA-binding transcriptional LysR family regulator|nr:LysR substrate-binding domain-containing protein [Hyphomicrobiaceae bacterium]